MSNRKQARLEAKQFIDTLSVQPYPILKKCMLRALALIFRCQCVKWHYYSLVGGSKEEPTSSPMSQCCYDTSGVYTDPNHEIDYITACQS